MGGSSLKTTKTEWETLAWVNKVRSDYGMDPIKAMKRGRRGDRLNCSIARSLRNGKILTASVSGSSATLYLSDGKTTHVVLPPAATEFVNEFDTAKLKDLLYK